ncbi:ABC transporter permease [Cesiribacter andamanensis]|uniref:Macrolide export ATP-binding/permease protein MacB n=1 Tax=Cesiribacter andamanensis AMV16 TaxID=1279009 RepID=M7N666_9BACT|nr:ABC transporter permease [Cesiribacter andamanensis]EMR02752.1 Macrolide export ATP-binding/permease protein MacB [Cesiribacter andamanensis AMV16]
MFLNYLKIAWRSLLKSKVYTLLNILGLAIGLSCFILISLYVLDELSYDRYHAKADRIYRINSDIRFGDSEMHMAETPDVMGAILKKDYPQVEEYVRLYTNSGSQHLKKGDGYLNEAYVAHADSSFFRVFSFTPLAGDLDKALSSPNSVVLTESMALKYFGTTEVVGRPLQNIRGQVFDITAVIEDMPANGHFRFDFIFSMDNFPYEWGSYLSHNFHTYLLLKEGVGAEDFQPRLDQYIVDHAMPRISQMLNVKTLAELEASGNSLAYSLTPLTEIHLYSDRSSELSPSGNIQYVYIFSAVALFILLIACVNFMNLATARSAGRAREVGIRKVLGSRRGQLVVQFLTEATLMALLAMIIALVLVVMVLPYFNELAAKSLSMELIRQPYFLLFLLMLPFGVGLLAGSYPAFFLSAFRPIQVLKGTLTMGAKGGDFRNVLVVFQFATSIILIIGTMVVYRQLAYIQTKNLGFDKEQVLVVENTWVLENRAAAFKNEVLQMAGVQSGTYSGFLPINGSYRNNQSFSKEAVMNSTSGFNMQRWQIDYDYLNTLGMELVAGRNFSSAFGGDSSAVIINETTAQMLGYEDPIGKKIYQVGDYATGAVNGLEIIGVVRNFHFESMHQQIGPLCMVLNNHSHMASFKVDAAKIPALLSGIEDKWEDMAQGMPFSYRFLDDDFTQMYRAEQQVGQITLIFTALAIVVACLGLFGLSTFIAERRAKEIGIRKVLGASVEGLVQLLSKEFLRLVLIAFLIASPLAWWAMHTWLQDFAYRIDLSWWIFAGAGILALIIALATVSVQALKAATANPVKNLRTE